MVSKDDWRRTDQEEYLMGARLLHIPCYHPASPRWEHEHCEFCWEKIAEYEGCQHSGYCTLDRRHWICEKCFEDFQGEFNFQVQQEL